MVSFRTTAEYYRKMKLYKGDRIERDKCPICGFELVRLKYVGNGTPLAEFWIKEFVEDLHDEHGFVKWVEAPEPSKW